MMRRKPAPRLERFIFVSLAILACTALLLPACSRGGRSNVITGVPPVGGTPPTTGSLISVSGGHVAIYLRDFEGNPIDINVDSTPYSPKQTCGYCHNYHVIEEGYHFQQGAEELDDNWGSNNGTYDFVLSPGMIGKW